MQNRNELIQTIVLNSRIPVIHSLDAMVELAGFQGLFAHGVWFWPENEREGIRFGDERIVFNPTKMTCDVSDANYLGVLFHEFAHATGHRDRLNRFTINSDPYQRTRELVAYEEIIAETTSQMLMDYFGFATDAQRDFSNRYIARQMGALQGDTPVLLDLTKINDYAESAMGHILFEWARIEQNRQAA